MIATIALAALLLDPAAKPAAAAASPAPAASEVKAKPTKYCVESAATGTRVARRTCLTRAEWLDQGFDPLKPQD